MIMQENHSFDNYFGTYPGADGIPMVSGTPTVCSPNPVRGTCDAPYHDTGDIPPFEGRLPGLEKKITKQTKNETGRTAMLKYLIL